MCQFIESIRIENGKIWNIDFHNQRMHETRKAYFNITEFLDIKSIISPKEYSKRTKCRIKYNESIISIEYFTYYLRPINSLQLIQYNNIDYSFKKYDRSLLNELFSKRNNCDDILIVKNNLLTDTSTCNIALFNGQDWYTPQKPLLKGVQRQYLLSKGLIKAKDIHISDLIQYNRIRLFNALITFGEIEFPTNLIYKEQE
ncbi:aminotransferase class IV [Coprobacter secundus]|uniref:4-amino-4-deoxychorismate lyase n=1 Tax=Coprobacter secundus subsp. similis TaxID=2751153 RepID=A0A7G1HUS4_9BACT|nr:aminotransferase class IV [Coprobacter secundus]BCI63499.1 4-amino-4-deoxychorismate lyase [Coprobacter secundus subsp. similis]CCY36290.1 putative uncharacterized protein [Tannerella sp. CAG:118]